MAVKIIGTGSYVPERVLSNFDLEKLVDTSDEWIRTRTGIEERHLADPDQACSDIALHACRNALAMANTAAAEIDLIVFATVTGDRPLPSTACILQSKLGAENAVAFDVQAACSGFLYSLDCANAMMTVNASYRKALLVGAEKLSSITDWDDRNTCVLFGDGAGAVVLSRETEPEAESCVLASKLGSDGNHADLLYVTAGGSAKPSSHDTVDAREHFLRMEGQEVFKLAVNSMVQASQEVLEQAGKSIDQVRWLIPHQANLRIIKAVGKRLGIPEERVFVNVNKYGNTSAATIVISLDEIVRSGEIKAGDYILLTAFGGGLTWGASLLRW